MDEVLSAKSPTHSIKSLPTSQVNSTNSFSASQSDCSSSSSSPNPVRNNSVRDYLLGLASVIETLPQRFQIEVRKSFGDIVYQAELEAAEEEKKSQLHKADDCLITRALSTAISGGDDFETETDIDQTQQTQFLNSNNENDADIDGGQEILDNLIYDSASNEYVFEQGILEEISYVACHNVPS